MRDNFQVWNDLINKEDELTCKKNAPSRSRTYNPLIRSQMRYPLRYGRRNTVNLES